MVQNVRTVADLIQEYRDRTGDSYGDMATRSATSGNEVTRAVFQRLGTLPPKNFPDPPTIHALAHILDVPVTTVVLAAAASLGLHVKGDPDAMWLPAGTEHLTADDRAAIRSVTRALVDARSATPDPGPIEHPEPAVQYDYTLAARRGPSDGRRLRQEQDDAAESQ